MRVIKLHKNNCLFFAIAAWWRWRNKGAYIWIRKSRHIWGLHWGVFYKGRMIHFHVRKPDEFPKVLLQKLWYDGLIKRSD